METHLIFVPRFIEKANKFHGIVRNNYKVNSKAHSNRDWERSFALINIIKYSGMKTPTRYCLICILRILSLPVIISSVKCHPADDGCHATSSQQLRQKDMARLDETLCRGLEEREIKSLRQLNWPRQ